MKLLKVLFLCFAGLVFSQSSRFVYQVSMKLDSLHPEKITKEYANLDVNAQGSVFYAANTIKRDSLFKVMRQRHDFDFDKVRELDSKIDYVIRKNYATRAITYENRIGWDEYAYTEEKPFQWKILSDTLTIGEYFAQKAETTYGGRTWVVWFTPELPVLDGPYKFSGLPGLIIKAEDTTGDFSFDLVETKKIAAPFELRRGRGQTVETTKEKYNKMLVRYRKDPFATIMGRMNSYGWGRGNRNSDRMRRMRERVEKEVKEKNNLIERLPQK